MINNEPTTKFVYYDTIVMTRGTQNKCWTSAVFSIKNFSFFQLFPTFFSHKNFLVLRFQHFSAFFSIFQLCSSFFIRYGFNGNILKTNWFSESVWFYGLGGLIYEIYYICSLRDDSRLSCWRILVKYASTYKLITVIYLQLN